MVPSVEEIIKSKIKRLLLTYKKNYSRKPVHYASLTVFVVVGLLFVSIYSYNQVHHRAGSRADAIHYLVPNTIPDNCSVDNTAALQAWIASLPANSDADFKNGECFLIQGTLKIQSTTGLTINGNGANFERTDPNVISVSNVLPIFFILQNNQLTINNVNLHGGWDGVNYSGAGFEGHDGFQLECNNGVVINGANVQHMQGDGISLQFSTGGKLTNGVSTVNYNVLVINSNFNMIGYHGITFEAAVGATFENDTFSNVMVDSIDSEYDIYIPKYQANGDPIGVAEDNINIVNNVWNRVHYIFYASIQGQGVQEQNVVISGNQINSNDPILQIHGVATTKLSWPYWNQGLYFQNNTNQAVPPGYGALPTNGGSIGSPNKPVDRIMAVQNVNDVNISNNTIHAADGAPTYFHNTPYLSMLDANGVTGVQFNGVNQNGLTLVNNDFTGAYSIFQSPTNLTSSTITNQCGNKYGADKITGLSDAVDFTCSSPAPTCPPEEVGDPGKCYYPTPNTPTSVAATATGPSNVNITWNAANDNSGTVAGYYVMRSTGSTPGQNIQVVGSTAAANATSFSDNTTTAGTKYSYFVESYDSGNATNVNIPVNISPLSAESSADDVTTPANSNQPPSVPLNIVTTIISPNAVKIAWSASTDSSGTLAGYYVLRNGQVVASITAPTTKYTDNTLLPGTTYIYNVESFDTTTPIGISAISAASSIKTPVYPSTPTALAAVTDLANPTTSIDLSWTGSTDTGGPGVAGYNIRNGTTGLIIAKYINSTCSACTYVISGLTPNTAYSFQVEAFDTNLPTPDISNHSKLVSISTTSGAINCLAPTTPSNLTQVSVGSGNFKISWMPSTMPSQSNPSCNGFTVSGYYVYNTTYTNGVANSPTLLDTVIGGAIKVDNLNSNLITASTTYNVSLVTYDTNTPQDLSAPTSLLAVTTAGATNTPPGSTNPVSAIDDPTNSSSSINVSWNVPVCLARNGCVGVLGYDVYRISPGSTTPELLAPGDIASDTPTTASNVQSLVDNGDNGAGLIPSSTYKYYVVAVDKSSTPLYSVNSATVSATTTAAATTIPPTTPTGLSASAISSAEVDLSWNPSTDPSGPGLGGYYILRNGQVIDFVYANTTSYADVSVSSSTSYNYTVEAYDISSPILVSLQSQPASATTPTATTIIPSIPSGISVTSPNSSEVDVSWVASNDTGGPGLGGYYILQNGNIVGTTAASTTTYQDFTVSPSTSYTYTVEAFDLNNPANVSNPSSGSNVTTPNAPVSTDPTIPANVVSSSLGATSVKVTWNASTDTSGPGIGGYYVIRDGVTIASLSSNSLSYVDNAVSGGITYSYFIESFDTTTPAFVSAPSNISSVTTPTPPDTTPPNQPTNLAANTISGNQINLSWTPSTDNVGVKYYDIYRDGVKIVSLSGTTYGDSNLSSLTKYTYYVVAQDAAGNSSVVSISSSAVTLGITFAYTYVLGTVTNATTKAPVSFALVRTVDPASATTGQAVQAYTNTLGQYFLTNLSSYHYHLYSYSKTGFTPLSLYLKWPAGKIIINESLK